MLIQAGNSVEAEENRQGQLQRELIKNIADDFLRCYKTQLNHQHEALESLLAKHKQQTQLQEEATVNLLAQHQSTIGKYEPIIKAQLRIAIHQARLKSLEQQKERFRSERDRAIEWFSNWQAGHLDAGGGTRAENIESAKIRLKFAFDQAWGKGLISEDKLSAARKHFGDDIAARNSPQLRQIAADDPDLADHYNIWYCISNRILRAFGEEIGDTHNILRQAEQVLQANEHQVA